MGSGKGIPKSPEHRAKISTALRGKKRNPEHSQAISAAKKGKPLHPNFIAGAAIASHNQIWTEERRKALSDAKRDKRPIEERFWSQVDKSNLDGCWEWKGARMKSGLPYGYCSFSIGYKQPGRFMLAHRMAWELTYGPLPNDGTKILHHCDNPPCCRPGHLFLGSQADNVADMIAKGRQRILRGSESPIATLSPEIAATIRQIYSSGNISQTELGKQFGVSQAVISKVILKTHWTSQASN